MGIGPKLIVNSSILGSILLSLLLYKVTSGDSYLPIPPVEGPEISIQEQSMIEPVAPDNPELSTTDAQCLISEQYPAQISQWCELITVYANKRNLSPDLIAAIILQESGGNPEAYSKSGAVGLMQVMPSDGLAADFMCANGPCFKNRPTTDELWNPEFNISYGTKILAGLLNRHGDIREALKAYGPVNVGYYYADKILGLYQQYRAQ
jgi:soluble lytic murein transglycosylase-like protein